MIELNIHKTLQAQGGEMELRIEVVINRHSLTSLFGPSGAGKTSILRMIAGLMTPDKGNIVVNGSQWWNGNRKINLTPQKRKAGLVFQDFALFPNMTVYENLRYALEKKDDIKRVDELMEVIALGDLRFRKPDTLSGGQRQRVALARALVQRPEILMLDEPLSALDLKMRSELQHYILDIHRQYGLTTILVSHDVSEVIRMSDTMIVMDHGKMVSSGKPAEVFTKKSVSGKFQFTGEIVSMERQDFLFILSILIGTDIVKVIADEKEVVQLSIGDKVMVASKAFNPVIRKI